MFEVISLQIKRELQRVARIARIARVGRVGRAGRVVVQKVGNSRQRWIIAATPSATKSGAALFAYSYSNWNNSTL